MKMSKVKDAEQNCTHLEVYDFIYTSAPGILHHMGHQPTSDTATQFRAVVPKPFLQGPPLVD